MKVTYKYGVILGATLALSFCQGRNQQSSIYDPSQGANYMTAPQYLNAGGKPNVLPADSLRSQRYALRYTERQANDCINTATETQQLSDFCNQVINDYLTKVMGINYQNYASENIQITGPNGGTFDYNTSDRLSSQNAPWLSKYLNFMGGTNPNAQGYYRTPMNMQSFCHDPASVTSIQYSSPCGRMNWSEATIAVNANGGYNQMRQGNFFNAYQTFGPGQYLNQRSPGLYGTVLSRRDVKGENKALSKELEASWKNMKALPKNTGLRILNRVMDVPASKLEAIVSGLEARLSGMSANNYAQADYNHQETAYNDQASDYYQANYYNATRASQYSTLRALQPDEDCPVEKYTYVIGDVSTPGATYKIDCKK